MRIIALTKNETPVLNMANGAGISTQKIPEGEESWKAISFDKT